MITKTRAAFMLTAQGLFEKFPRVYFWTVTFATVHSDWESSELFSKFLHHLRAVVGKGWGGVRVVELHREHGVHYHLLVTERLAVDLVRRVGRCYGIGRIHVCRAKPEACLYLGKYLSKQKNGPKTKTGRNARRWAVFGEVPRTRVSDLINDSPMWVFRREHKLHYLGYWQEKILGRCWDRGERNFKMAWHILRGGSCVQDAFAIAEGKMEVGPEGKLVVRWRAEHPF